MKLVNHFADFLRDTVNLNQSRIDLLKDRVSAIETFLSENDVFGPEFKEIDPQGSWAHGTIIKPSEKNPEFDADVLLYMDKVKQWEPKDYVENLYQEFRANGIYKEKVSRNTRCVVIDYKGEFHIDVVPTIVEDGFLSDDETFITNRIENEFEQTNPLGYLRWFQSKNTQTGGMLVKVIRLAKYLRDIKKNFSVKSILLTTLLADQVKTGIWDPDDADESYPDVPTALKTIFNRLNDFLQKTEAMPHIYNPSMPEEDFVRHWDEQKYQNFRKWISFYTRKINAAYDANRDESIILWREIFGDDFAKGIEVTPLQKSPYDVAHRQTPPWNMDLKNKVTVGASIYKNQYSGLLASLIHGAARKLNKRVWVKFEATTDAPSFDSIQWQVVNTGCEASRCLRGGFYSSNEGRNIRWESTAFKGRHWVEAFVIKDDKCIARSGEFEINIE